MGQFCPIADLGEVRDELIEPKKLKTWGGKNHNPQCVLISPKFRKNLVSTNT